MKTELRNPKEKEGAILHSSVITSIDHSTLLLGGTKDFRDSACCILVGQENHCIRTLLSH